MAVGGQDLGSAAKPGRFGISGSSTGLASAASALGRRGLRARIGRVERRYHFGCAMI